MKDNKILSCSLVLMLIVPILWTIFNARFNEQEKVNSVEIKVEEDFSRLDDDYECHRRD